ncbi:hypothetical protein DDT91_19635 [Algoriphagus sp. AK58]|nr:hypothetical protein [Algoriphagus sp. AK58]
MSSCAGDDHGVNVVFRVVWLSRCLVVQLSRCPVVVLSRCPVVVLSRCPVVQLSCCHVVEVVQLSKLDSEVENTTTAQRRTAVADNSRRQTTT